tara:strand:+ start:6748 stop:8040 length:1293 start_codon:yes stop_codon:yes gene_type:complete
MENVQPIAKVKIIDKGSSHYRFWLAIRNAWGLEDAPDTFKLCPYAQTMFWLSILTVFSIVALIIPTGWFTIKLGRTLYKINEKWFVGRFLNDLLDKTPFGDALNEAPAELQKAPLITCAIVGICVMLTGLVVTIVVGLLSIGIWHLIALIPQIPMAIFIGICYVGWAIFWLLGLFGWLLIAIKNIAVMAAGWVATTAIALFEFLIRPEIWMAIGFWTLIVIAVGIGMVAFTWLSYKLFAAKWFAPILNWILITLNGYPAAKEKSKARQELAREQAAIDKKERPKRKIIPAFISSAWKSFAGVTKDIFSSHIYVKGSAVKVLGLGSIFFELFKAFYRGACPLYEAKTSEEITDMRTFYVYDYTNKSGTVMSGVVAKADYEDRIKKYEQLVADDINTLKNQDMLDALKSAKPVVANSASGSSFLMAKNTGKV